MLYPQLTNAGVADASRRAADEFMIGVSQRWTVADFDLWLHGSYRAAARSSLLCRSRQHWVAAERVAAPAIMIDAQEHVLRALDCRTRDGRADLLAGLVQKGALGLVPWACTAIWTPLDCVHVTLRDRVLSLFARDLSGPQEELAFVRSVRRNATFGVAAREFTALSEATHTTTAAVRAGTRSAALSV